MKHSLSVLVQLLLLCALLGVVGCASSGGERTKLKDHFSGRDAVVKIPFEGEFAEVKVGVHSFPANVHAINGVSALQTQQWNTAVEQLKQAVAEKPKNEKFHFALAVAYEVRGNFAEAKQEYLEANRLSGGSGMFDARAGLKRIEARGK